MYQIYCKGYFLDEEQTQWSNNEVLLHDSRSDELKVIEPKCDLELNKTGTLSFKVPSNHPYYSFIYKLRSEISLYQDGKWLFTGRVLNDEIDFHNFKVIQVEGELGYLLDSIQRSSITAIDDLGAYLRTLITNHNSQVDNFKKFEVGEVTVENDDGEFDGSSSYQDTLTVINNDLLSAFDGYLIPHNVGDTKYLDYLTTNELDKNEQTIQFGKNLIDLSQYINGENIATAIIALGAKGLSSTGSADSGTDDTTIEDDNLDRLDLSELGDITDGTIKHDNGSDYIYDEEAVKKYGKIFKVVKFDTIEEKEDLLKYAKKQLNYYKKQEFVIELNAFDLHLLNVNIQAINVGQRIKVVSNPHHINKYLIVLKMSIDIANPSKNSITLSTEERSDIDINSLAKKNKDNEDKTKKLKQDIEDADYAEKRDLSKYAKKVDVNKAFNELGELLEEL